MSLPGPGRTCQYSPWVKAESWVQQRFNLICQRICNYTGWWEHLLIATCFYEWKGTRSKVLFSSGEAWFQFWLIWEVLLNVVAPGSLKVLFTLRLIWSPVSSYTYVNVMALWFFFPTMPSKTLQKWPVNFTQRLCHGFSRAVVCPGTRPG